MDDQNPNSDEKFCRKEMNFLYNELTSLLPHQFSRDITCLSDQLEGATNYIKQLQTSLESLKLQKKEMMMGKKRNFRLSFCRDSSASGGLKLPRVDLDFCGSTLEVVLVTGSNCQFMLKHIVRILNEEGADVISASFSVVDDQTVLYTLHSKMGGCELENEAARISERLRKLVIDDDN